MLQGKRKPIEECETPSESPTESDTDDTETDSESSSAEGDNDSSLKENGPAEIDALTAFLKREGVDSNSSCSLVNSTPPDKAKKTASFFGSKPKSAEMTQLREDIQDLVGHLYKISMLIRRPIPHDRFTKCESINVSHYDTFDEGHIQNCFPLISKTLSLRLTHAMKRRRQYLIYNERHHEALAKPRKAQVQEDISVGRPPGSQREIGGNTSKPASMSHSQPNMHDHGASASRFGTNTEANTEATRFVPPENFDEVEIQSDAGTLSTHASTNASEDKVHIPSRPRGTDGRELEQFECPYCFHLVEIRNSREWK